MIFIDTTQFKDYAGGAINSSVQLSSMQPAYHQVVQNEIIPLIGRSLWNTIQESWDNNPTPAVIELMSYVRRPIALLTVWNYAKIGAIQFSESGMLRAEGEDVKTAYKYQENQHKEFTRDAGFDALEELQLYLAENAANYPDWQDSREHKAALGMLINSSRTFRAYYGRKVNRFVFENLKAIIKNLELFVIEPTIGAQQYTDLLDGIFSNNLVDHELVLLQKLQRALTHFAIEEALQKQFIQLQGDRVVKLESLEPQSYTKSSNPTMTELYSTKRYLQFEANGLLKMATDYLQTNLDLFPNYKVYYEAMQAEETVQEDERMEGSTSKGNKGGLILF